MTPQAHAEKPRTPTIMDSKALGETCTSTSDALDLLCLEYIVGVQDTVSLLRDGDLKEGELPYCLPEAFTPKALLSAVKIYYVKNPKAQTQGTGVMASIQVITALVDAFPCK
jgi:hypothetical protein